MSRVTRRYGSWLSCLLVCGLILPAAASERTFPFDRELMLDVAPMPGSKRVPIIEIDANGAASIDLWCASLRGQASVGGFDQHRSRSDAANAMPCGSPERR